MSVSSFVKWDDDININIEAENAHKSPDSGIISTQKVSASVFFTGKNNHVVLVENDPPGSSSMYTSSKEIEMLP